MTSHVTFARNLVHGVRNGFARQGIGATENRSLSAERTAYVLARDGHALTIEYNTIVGLEGALVNLSHGEGHVLRGNVIMGLSGTAASAGYDSAAYFKIGKSPNADILSSDGNCFIVGNAGFQMVAIYPTSGPVQHYTLEQSRSLFNMDRSSSVVIATDASAGFVDQSSYALSASTPCGGVGHLAP